MTKQIEKFLSLEAIRLSDYPAYRVFYHDMWFDGNGYTSNQRYCVASNYGRPIYYGISDNASDANIISALRADCILPLKTHFHVSEVSTNENIYVENDNMSQMFELELMRDE
jgi:hypothetical protein